MFNIVVVNKNNLEGLVATLESIISQEDVIYHVLIKDGQSDDGSVSYLKEFCRDRENFSILEKLDNGIYDAMNICIDAMTQEYTVFMNSGDCFASKNVLKRSIEYLQKDKLIAFGWSFTDENKTTVPYPWYESWRLGLPMGLCHQAIIFPSHMLKTTSFNLQYKLLAYYEWVYKFVKSGGAIVLCDYRFAILQRDGLSKRQSKIVRKEKLKIFENTGVMNKILIYLRS